MEAQPRRSALGMAFRGMFNYRGRTSRAEYRRAIRAFIGLDIALAVVAMILGFAAGTNSSTGGYASQMVYSPFGAIFSTSDVSVYSQALSNLLVTSAFRGALVVGTVIAIPAVLAQFALAARRLHDMGLRAWAPLSVFFVSALSAVAFMPAGFATTINPTVSSGIAVWATACAVIVQIGLIMPIVGAIGRTDPYSNRFGPVPDDAVNDRATTSGVPRPRTVGVVLLALMIAVIGLNGYASLRAGRILGLDFFVGGLPVVIWMVIAGAPAVAGLIGLLRGRAAAVGDSAKNTGMPDEVTVAHVAGAPATVEEPASDPLSMPHLVVDGAEETSIPSNAEPAGAVDVPPGFRAATSAALRQMFQYRGRTSQREYTSAQRGIVLWTVAATVATMFLSLGVAISINSSAFGYWSALSMESATAFAPLPAMAINTPFMALTFIGGSVLALPLVLSQFGLAARRIHDIGFRAWAILAVLWLTFGTAFILLVAIVTAPVGLPVTHMYVIWATAVPIIMEIGLITPIVASYAIGDPQHNRFGPAAPSLPAAEGEPLPPRDSRAVMRVLMSLMLISVVGHVVLSLSSLGFFTGSYGVFTGPYWSLAGPLLAWSIVIVLPAVLGLIEIIWPRILPAWARK